MKIFVSLIIMFVLLLSTSSCTSSISTSSCVPSKISIGVFSSDANPILSLSLSRAPKIGESTELIFTNNLRFYTTFVSPDEELISPSVHTWVEFTYANIKGSYLEAKYAVPIPLEEVLVSGQLDCEGNPFEMDDTLEVSGTIQLPREGIWEITAHIEAKGFNSEIVEKGFNIQTKIAVTQDIAAAMRYGEYGSGSLSYLEYFSYGRLGKKVPDEMVNPVVLELDISKIPEAGEEATLSCRISSLYDMSNFSAKINISKKLGAKTVKKIPQENLLIEGDLRWDGDIEKNKPVEFSALVKFPDEGEWEIYVSGDYPTNERSGFSDRIYLTITDEKSYYGWKD